MKYSARKHLLLLAVFLLCIGSGFTAGGINQNTGRQANTRQRPDSSSSADTAYFNPLAIPELRPPPEHPEIAVDSGVTTAADPRFGSLTSPHHKMFIPASELRPPAPAMSIPVLDRREPNRYDLNESV